MKTTYRLEHVWPHQGRNGFRYVPEHSALTLKRARELVAHDRRFEREGMRQRIVNNHTGKTVLYSRSKPWPKEVLAGIRNMRGY